MIDKINNWIEPRSVVFNPKFPYSYLLGKSYKIDKSDLYSDYENFIMYLAPANSSGVNVCPSASLGCISSCLNTSGHGRFLKTQQARVNRTLDYINNRPNFLQRLEFELQRKYRKHGGRIAVRLNGTSDLSWRPFIRKMGERYPLIKFYDYTKVKENAIASLSMDNYHVTFSKSEDNWETCKEMLALGVNVAAVFRKYMPFKYKGYPVLNGDVSDTRFLDPKGYIIGLSAKGDGKKDTSGFVIDLP